MIKLIDYININDKCIFNFFIKIKSFQIINNIYLLKPIMDYYCCEKFLKN